MRGARRPEPPRVATRIAAWLLPPGEREDILGDLHEAFVRLAAASWPRAALWYWGQVALFAGQELVDRVRDPLGGRRRWLRESVGRDAVGRGRRERGWEVTTMGAGLVQAIRRLRKDWRFSASMTLILGVGIGAGLVGYSVVARVLLDPLPYDDPERLGLIRVDIGGLSDHPGLAMAEVADLRTIEGAFVGAEAASAEFTATLDRGDAYEPVVAAGFSPGMLQLLGVTPILGRGFTEEDAQGGGTGVLVSHRFWQSHLGGAPDAVGQALSLDGRARPVLGVLPAGFALHLGRGANVSPDVQIWYAQRIDPTSRSFWGYRTLVRLESERTIPQVNQALEQLAARLLDEHPDAYGDTELRFEVRELRADLVDDVRPAINAALGGVVLLLLVAFTNGASLMLGRQRTRETDLAVRSALGAGRSRLLGTVLGEALVLTVAAGALGGLLAVWGVSGLRALDPPGIPRWSALGVDWSLFVAALGLGTVGFLASGFYPAWKAAGGSGWRLVRGDTALRGASGAAMRSALVGVQLALAVVLLFGAAVLGRSASRLARVDLGFTPSQRLAMTVPIDRSRFATPEEEATFWLDLTARMESIPGVTRAGAVSHLPLSGYAPSDAFSLVGGDTLNWEQPIANYFATLPGYLEAAGMELRAGRALEDEDLVARRAVAVVDGTLAEALFPGEDAVGRVFHAGWGLPNLEIVGVIRPPRVIDARSEVRPQVYVPASVFGWRPLSYVIHADGDLSALAGSARAQVDAAGSGRAVFDVRPLESYLADSTSALRLALKLVTLLAGLTAALAAFGLFSVMAYLTYQTRRASAIRSALGASKVELLRHHLSSGVRILLVAIPVGVGLSVVGSRLLRSMLYGISPYDPVSLASAAILATAIGVLASWLPARHAAGVDPMDTLRADG